MTDEQKQKGTDYALKLAENQIIKTARLILRPVTLTDAEDMFSYASDEETTRFVFPMNQDIGETRSNIAKYFIAAPLGKYGIEWQANGQFIGTIDLLVKEAGRKGELGYTLNKDYWGQGVMPEAAQELLRIGFEELDLIRIEARHDKRNPNSGKVMAKIGMAREGLFRSGCICKDEVVDDVIYGITKEMYFAEKRL